MLKKLITKVTKNDFLVFKYMSSPQDIQPNPFLNLDKNLSLLLKNPL